MEIRRAREDEYDRVADILISAFAPSGLGPGDDYYEELRDVAARTDSAEVWVAVEGPTVVGTVTWPLPGSAHREVAGDDEAEFRMLAVDPALQGRGVGGALIDWVVGRARSEGFRRLVLSTAPWSTTAHRLYEERGFVHVPDRDWLVLPALLLRVYALELG